MIWTFVIFIVLVSVGISYWSLVPVWRKHKYRIQLKNKSGTTLSREKRVLTPFRKFLMFWFLGTVALLVPYAWTEGNQNPVINFFECIRLAMRVFVVSDSIQNLTANMHPWFCSGSSAVFIEFYHTVSAGVCVLSGFFVFGFFVSFFNEFVAYSDYRQIHRFKNIYIMNELNARSLALAENIFIKEKNIRIYFCDMMRAKKDDNYELIHRAHLIGAFTMKRDLTEVRIKGRLTSKSQTIYFIGNVESENIKQAKHVVELYKKNKRVNNPKTKLFVYANSPESELILDDMNAALYGGPDKAGKGRSGMPMKLRRVNTFNKFAVNYFYNNATDTVNRKRGFFDVYNQTESKIKNLNVLLVGCGKYGSEFLKMLCSMGQMPSYRLNVHIFDDKRDIVNTFVPELWKHSAGSQTNKKYKENSRHWYDFPYYNLKFANGIQINSPEFYDYIEKINVKNPVTHIFLMAGSDDLNLRLAMKLRTRLKRTGGDCGGKPQINAFIKDEIKSLTVKNAQSDLKTFDINAIGVNLSRYSKEEIEQSYVEDIAINVHRNFLLKDKFNEYEKNIDARLTPETKGEKRFVGILRNIKDCAIVAFRNFEHEINFCLRQNILSLNGPARRKEITAAVTVKLNELREQVEEFRTKILNSCKKQDEKSFVNGCFIFVRELLDNAYNGMKEIITNDDAVYVNGFGKREYYRNSCTARVLFEKALFDLGYLEMDTDPESEKRGRVILKDKSKLVPEFDGEFLEKMKKFWEENDSDPNAIFNRSWAELNNIFQKRWLAFMWGEGYEKYTGKGTGKDAVSKMHAYIEPYKAIYLDKDSNMTHTIEISYVPQTEKDAEHNR